jgi:hypothetical protein
MKKKILILAGLLLGVYFVSTLKFNDKQQDVLSNNEIVELHKKNLENSPFKDNLKLSKKERKAIGLPPNKYFESEWELTMNPITGKPTTKNIKIIREQLEAQRKNELLAGRVPGDASNNNWVERGPNNVGGRTRGLMFDPNDTTNETVFAGGVSGGLWKNTNISNVNSSWTRVGIPENLSVSVITVDPNNSNVFYVGTGESYVAGDVNGDGVWKSEDGGATWSHLFGGITGDTTFQSESAITVNSPSNISGDYASYETTNFGTPLVNVITEDLVLANDTTDPTLGCDSFGATVTGKIALIRRGACNFTVKVKHAQDAGAIGVIMMNNVVGTPVPMGGTDDTITIPSVMISKSDGDAIEAALASGTVNVSLNPQSEDGFTGNLVPGIQHINDIKIRNNNGVSEIYVAAGDSFYSSANATTYLGGPEFGLYKSIDNGTTWTEVSLPLTADGNKHCPNDIEIGAENKIWMSTTNSTVFGDGGGVIFSSTDGETFQEEYVITDGARTQIAVSSTVADKIYVLAQLTGQAGTDPQVSILKTEDAFATEASNMTLPNDADTGISANDFTRGQAFYDLMLEVDPANDENVYVGGIDLFKSTNGASAWNQLSHWYGGFGYQYVHADQHAMTFSSTDSNKVLFGNDGGVYYSSNSGASTLERNLGYNTSQFYTVGVGPTASYTGDYFAGGLQDNGTQLIENASTTGPDSAEEIFGGDGAYTFFDQDGTDRYVISNYVYNSAINLYNFDGADVTINNENASNGAFINPCALDSNLDILYTNYSSGANNIIRRYSGIKALGTLSKTSLTDTEFDNTPTAFTVSPHTTSSSTLFVGTFLGDIFKITNADTTPVFIEIELDNVIVGSVSDIEVGQTEDDIFVTIHNYGVESIWYTSDGGATWSPKEGDLPDMPVKSILQNPLNLEEVIVGTELGVWYTNNFSDASPTWNQAYNGMSNVKVTDLDVRDDNMVFAATYGRGVFSGQFTDLDPAGDEDGDTILNAIDNCPFVANTDQADSDNNGIGDVCQDTDNDDIIDINDNCPDNANPGQEDADGNGVGDACQDSDGDNVFDAVDNCLDVSNPDQTDTNDNGIGDACDTSYELPENISVEVTSETCEGEDNGEITVTAIETYVTYTATLTGSDVNLTEAVTDNSYTFSDLAVGDYSICVAVDGRDYQQCYEVSVVAAEPLDGVFGAANNMGNGSSEVAINVSRGTAPYTVEFNGEVIKITNDTSFDVQTIGSGLLEVKSSKVCEGTLKKIISNSTIISASPNPVVNNLTVTLPNIEKENIPVQIFNVQGKSVFNSVITKNSGKINIPFESLNSGVYFVKLELDTPKTFKIIK